MLKVEEKKYRPHEPAVLDKKKKKKKKKQIVKPEFLHKDVRLRSDQLTSA